MDVGLKSHAVVIDDYIFVWSVAKTPKVERDSRH